MTLNIHPKASGEQGKAASIPASRLGAGRSRRSTQADRSPVIAATRSRNTRPRTGRRTTRSLWMGSFSASSRRQKVTLGPQNVLTQAERCSKGIDGSSFNFNGYRAPFLYSTNGEVLWFHDVRSKLNRSRKVAGLHTPQALREMLTRDVDADRSWFTENPNQHPWLRLYQIEHAQRLKTPSRNASARCSLRWPPAPARR